MAAVFLEQERVYIDSQYLDWRWSQNAWQWCSIFLFGKLLDVQLLCDKERYHCTGISHWPFTISNIIQAFYIDKIPIEDCFIQNCAVMNNFLKGGRLWQKLDASRIQHNLFMTLLSRSKEETMLIKQPWCMQTKCVDDMEKQLFMVIFLFCGYIFRLKSGILIFIITWHQGHFVYVDRCWLMNG